MSATSKIRLAHLKKHIDGIAIRKLETRDFLEVTMIRHGDIVTYRVYGDNQKGFYLC